MPNSRRLSAAVCIVSSLCALARAEHWVPKDFSGAKINYVTVGSYPDEWGNLVPFLRVSLLDSTAKAGSREYEFRPFSDAQMAPMTELLTRARDQGARVLLGVDDSVDVFYSVQYGAGEPTALSAFPAGQAAPGIGNGFDPMGRARSADRSRVPLFRIAAPARP